MLRIRSSCTIPIPMLYHSGPWWRLRIWISPNCSCAVASRGDSDHTRLCIVMIIHGGIVIGSRGGDGWIVSCDMSGSRCAIEGQVGMLQGLGLWRLRRLLLLLLLHHGLVR